jgi:hypothetical protein
MLILLKYSSTPEVGNKQSYATFPSILNVLLLLLLALELLDTK